MKLNQLAAIVIGVSASCLLQAATVNSNIELSLTIPKLCTIANPTSKLLLPISGQQVSAQYAVTCNTGYTIRTTSDNYRTSDWSTFLKNGSLTLKTGIGTKDPSGSDIRIMDPAKSYPGSRVDNFTLNARLTQAVTPTTTAGTYTDQYRITVTY
jgi:type 1 fimbria pilin